MTEFNKKIIIGDFVIRKSKAKERECSICNEKINEEEVMIINTSEKRGYQKNSETIHISCLSIYLKNLISDLENNIKKQEQEEQKNKSLIERYTRLNKEIPEKVKRMKEKIEEYKQLDKKIIDILDRNGLLSDVVVEEL